MDVTESIRTVPLEVERTSRENEFRAITSARAGKIIPLVYAPLLREDRIFRGQLRIKFEMQETVKTLLNSIGVTVYAHFVPFLAFERFNGLDALNRSYKKEPEVEGEQPIPFFETHAYDRAAEIYRTMGIHAVQGAQINSAVVEAYNTLVNFRRRARSEKLPERLKGDTTLARAFWRNSATRHIVPDYDAAMIDGEVELEILNTRLPVRGLSISPNSPSLQTRSIDTGEMIGPAGTHNLYMNNTDPQPDIQNIHAELVQGGLTLSLADIERIKKTAAFAAIRKKYSGIDEDHILDLLMDGLRVPDAQMSQPILLDRKSTIMGYARRYATDGASLSQSVTTGETFVDLRLRTPPMNTGGIILITAEIVPEQLYERQKDHFLHTNDPDLLPAFIRDYLDPEKVDVVTNDHVDVEHSDPAGTFGYAPLNHVWRRALPNVGGKYMRRLDDSFDEDRQRIWGNEVRDPTLTDDFYLVGQLHHNVFADTLADPFEIQTQGRLEIVGNTVFGKGLHENTDDFADLRDQVDTDRIEQPDQTGGQ